MRSGPPSGWDLRFPGGSRCGAYGSFIDLWRNAFYPFVNWVVCLSVMSCYNSVRSLLCIQGVELSPDEICKYFLPFCGSPFQSVEGPRLHKGF